jgi:hypothetical protein
MSSTGQPIGQTPPIASQPNAHGSSRAGTLLAPNPQPRTSEEQPLETPSAEMLAIEQVSAELKCHMK